MQLNRPKRRLVVTHYEQCYRIDRMIHLLYKKHIDATIYKSYTVNDEYILLLFWESNTFSLFGLSTKQYELFEIESLPFISDACVCGSTIYFVGGNNCIIKFNIITKTFQSIVFVEDTHYTAIAVNKDKLIVGDTNYFSCIEKYHSKIDVWDITSNKKICDYPLMDAVNIKQIIYDPINQRICVLWVDSEDYGEMLIFSLPDNNIIDLVVLFEASTATVLYDKLIIAGGYPPLNIQIHDYITLRYENEMCLNQDYPKDEFGSSLGNSFFANILPVDKHLILYPYSGGDILEIDIIQNTCKKIYSSEETYIYISLIKNKLVSISKEGYISVFDTDDSAYHSQINDNENVFDSEVTKEWSQLYQTAIYIIEPSLEVSNCLNIVT